MEDSERERIGRAPPGPFARHFITGRFAFAEIGLLKSRLFVADVVVGVAIRVGRVDKLV